MKRTMIYLKESQYISLERLARRQRKSMAELIRLAVDNLLKKQSKEINYMSIVGIGKGEPGKVSEEAEKYLKELFKKKTK